MEEMTGERRNKRSPFLTVEELAEYLRITVRQIRRMRTEGTGPPFRRHGGQIVYHQKEVDRWSEDHSFTSTGGTGL